MFLRLSVCFTLLLLAHTASAQLANKSFIVAGGCFWCTESDFEKFPGVISAESGYTGGSTDQPNYKQVTQGGTGHYEAVKIVYNPAEVSLPVLLEYFWKTIDPTDPIGQFCDKGSSYRTALFFQDESEQQLFEESKKNLQANKPFKKDVVTKILPAATFFPAEDYHQDYYKRNPIRYNYYRRSCGRDKTIERLWGEVASKKL